MIAKILISPSLETRVEEIEKILASLDLKNLHPDLLYFPTDTKLGINEAKKIKEHLSFKPFQAKGRGVVLEDASQLTMDAQNALLKTIEELPEQALIILGGSSETNFLPTILSRCQIIKIGGGEEQKQKKDYSEDIEKLLQADVGDRFEFIEKLKDKEGFLKSLVQYFHKNLNTHPEKTNINFLKELLAAEKWQKQNVNIRAILEYLMLLIPIK